MQAGAEAIRGKNDTLTSVALVYIFTPAMIFLLGWMKLRYSVPLCVLIAAGIVLSRSTNPEAGKAGEDQSSPGSLAIGPGTTSLLLALLVAFLIGLSPLGYGVKNPDFAKHASFLRDLIEGQFPLAYEHTGVLGRPGTLVIYLGYYLPAALVGKVLGWHAAWAALYLWTVLGTYLTLSLFFRLTGGVTLLGLVLILAFGGLDIIGWTLLNGWLTDGTTLIDDWVYEYALRGNGKNEMGGVFWIYADTTTFLYWGPHHVLPGLIVLFLILETVLSGRNSGRVFFLFCAMPLFSMFATLGILPYLGLSVLCSRFRSLITLQNVVVAPLVLLVLGLYITSNHAEYPHGFLWKYQDILNTWPTLLLFYVVEIGICAFFCWKVGTLQKHPRWQWLFLVALGCLLFCPLYRMGEYCDFTTKVALPSLAVMTACYVVALSQTTTRRSRRCARTLTALLLIGCMSGLSSTVRAVHGILSYEPFGIVPIEKVEHINLIGPMDQSQQLFGDAQGLFWRYLSKPIPYLQTANTVHR